MNKSKIVHREVMHLKVSPNVVRDFISTPERILDYYPSPISCGVIDVAKKFYCQGKSGISLLEQTTANGIPDSGVIVTLKVSTATPFEGEITESKIIENLFFIMYEDWLIEAQDSGTRLTKTWRNIDKRKMKFLPLGMIVRHSAKGESKTLVRAWEAAASSK